MKCRCCKKKNFVLINTFDKSLKNSFISHIENDIATIKKLNKTFVENIVDLKTLNQEIFVLIVIFETFLKNSFASYSENIEISIAMNMFFLDYFINENISDIEIFNFVIEIITFSKNLSIHQIEHSKTLKKISIYIEFFAFFAFDFNIDIDFKIYTIDSAIIYSNIQFSIALFSSFISSITIQIVDTITNYEKKKQFICFVNSSITLQIIEKISNYEKEQFSTCFVVYTITNYVTNMSDR